MSVQLALSSRPQRQYSMVAPEQVSMCVSPSHCVPRGPHPASPSEAKHVVYRGFPSLQAGGGLHAREWSEANRSMERAGRPRISGTASVTGAQRPWRTSL